MLHRKQIILHTILTFIQQNSMCKITEREESVSISTTHVNAAPIIEASGLWVTVFYKTLIAVRNSDRSDVFLMQRETTEVYRPVPMEEKKILSMENGGNQLTLSSVVLK